MLSAKDKDALDRVKAGLKFSAVHGDSFERGIFEGDVRDLVDVVVKQQNIIESLKTVSRG